MPRQSKAEKLADLRIDRAHRTRCCDIAIDIMDISKVFKVGRESIAAGDNDQVLGDKIFAFVQTIRRN